MSGVWPQPTNPKRPHAGGRRRRKTLFSERAPAERLTVHARSMPAIPPDRITRDPRFAELDELIRADEEEQRARAKRAGMAWHPDALFDDPEAE